MKQQMYENIGHQIVDEARHHQLPPHLNNLIAKLEILLGGGNKAASVERELTNGFAPRDPENMDPYGPQNHPLNPEREAKVIRQLFFGPIRSTEPPSQP
jgi:hypothetical protein